jgi:flagellar biosynthetic protein FliP
MTTARIDLLCRLAQLTGLLAVLFLASDAASAMPTPQPEVRVEASPSTTSEVLTASPDGQRQSLVPEAAEKLNRQPAPVELTQAAPQPENLTPQVPAGEETPSAQFGTSGFQIPGLGGPDEWTSPEGITSAIKSLALLTVVSLAPAVLLMTTCFVRIVIVLGLLRQSLGSQQLPSNQVVTSLALFMTLLIMAPVWNEVYEEAIVPYTEHELTLEEAWDAGVKPVRGFMSAQIERTGNSDDVWLFYKYLPEDTPPPSSYDDVPLTVLLPAFMLSELKTAFLIGFQIFLPFLIIDLVVASVTISMGMFMVPPMFVSLPMKLLLFVLVDGWNLVVGMLMDSFQRVT